MSKIFRNRVVKSFVHGELRKRYEISKGDEYVIHLSTNKNNEHAVALTNNDIKIEGKNSLTLSGHTNKITDLKFSSESPNLLLSSSLDGTINAWDLRDENSLVLTFNETSDDVIKRFSSFDFNADERILCAGTELVREDAFLIFWDVRTTKCLGGYWNSHTEEVTQVRFHPFVSHSMATASVDGLINIFDLNESSESEALQSTLNVETSINRLCWYKDKCACITTTEEYQLWHHNEASFLLTVSRTDLTSQPEPKIDYLIDTFTVEDCNYIAAGNNEGTVFIFKNHCNAMKPHSVLSSHTDIVRTVTYCSEGRYLLTGGEDGVVCQWKFS